MSRAVAELLQPLVAPGMAPAAPRRPRDSQRSRLYKAERAALYGSDWDCMTTENHISYAQAYVDHVASLPFFQARWPRHARRGLTVRPGASNAFWEGTNRITLTKWGRRNWVMLHEMAHWVTDHPLLAPHGPEFAGAYINLVGEVIGHPAAIALTYEFDTNGVRYALPKHP